MRRSVKIASSLTIQEKNMAKKKDNTDNTPKEYVFDKYEIRLDERIPKPKFTFTSLGRGCSPQGDIIAIKAKSKNGKTFLATIFAAVVLGAEMGDLKSEFPEESRVLFFDTEQNKTNTQILMSRIHIIRGWSLSNNDRLHVYSMREMPLSERMDYIITKTKEHKPTAVFIDGIADLLQDFNDISTSNQIIGKLMTLSSYNHCAVFFVLHTNKTDGNMKGHLGTLGWQKCSDVFSVEKQKDGTFKVTETDCRNKPISDFSFKISDDGIPFISKTSK